MHLMLTAEADDPNPHHKGRSRIQQGLPNAFSPASLLPRPACLRQHVRSRIVGVALDALGGRSLLDGRRWTRPAEKVRSESVIQSVQLMFVIIQLGSVQLSSSRLSRLSSVFKVQGQGFVSFTEQRPEAGSGRKGQADALTMRAAVLDTIVKSEAGRGRRCRRRRRRSSPLL